MPHHTGLITFAVSQFPYTSRYEPVDLHGQTHGLLMTVNLMSDAASPNPIHRNRGPWVSDSEY